VWMRPQYGGPSLFVCEYSAAIITQTRSLH
jgi:hypothetical protein